MKPVWVVALALSAAAVATSAQTPRTDTRQGELRQVLGVSQAELAAINRGDIVARALGKLDRRYVGAVGFARFAVSPQFLVQRLHDIQSFKKSKMVLALGTLSNPPVPHDFARLALDRPDVDALRTCRVGSCDLRLGAEQIQHLRASDAFTGPDSPARIEAWFRGLLSNYAQSYLERGNDALMTYRDQRDPVSLRAESLALLDQSPELDGVTGLREHLRRFPANPLGGATDYLYWSKEAFGLKPVVSLTHITIASQSDATRSVTVMSSKQIYATHYLDASLAVTTVVSVPDMPGAVYVVYVNRSRSVIPGGIFAPLARSIVQRRTVDGMRTTLGDTRTRTESDYRASLGSTR